MKTTKKYADAVRKLDDSKFKKLPKRGYCVENNDQMFANMWSMFKLKYTPQQMAKMGDDKMNRTFGCCVADYAWTTEVKDAFYAHPYHQAYVKAMKSARHSMWGWWVLQCEPSSIEE